MDYHDLKFKYSIIFGIHFFMKIESWTIRLDSVNQDFQVYYISKTFKDRYNI